MCARATTCPAAAPSRHGSGQMTVALSFGLRSQSAHQARSAASRKPPYDVGCCIHRYIPAPVHAPPPSSAQTQHRDLRMACSSGFRNGGPGSNFLSMCVCLYSVPLSFVWFRVLLSLEGNDFCRFTAPSCSIFILGARFGGRRGHALPGKAQQCVGWQEV
jgi:hypothetical protein